MTTLACRLICYFLFSFSVLGCYSPAESLSDHDAVQVASGLENASAGQPGQLAQISVRDPKRLPDSECPDGVWSMCDNTSPSGVDPGYGYACQMPAGYGQHYQFPCHGYCDADDNWGVIEPVSRGRCEKAGGHCACQGLDGPDESGVCGNRWECEHGKD